jgi:hypothetical protein
MHRTGKTFRALMRSLTLASEGKNVIVECTNYNMARWTFDKAADIVSGFMGAPDIPNPLTLKIGDGTVRFSGPLREFELRHIARKTEKFEFVRDV